MTSSWRELPSLYRLRWQAFKEAFQEQARVWGRYYKNRRFAFADLVLGSLYLFRNPYRISRRFLQIKGEDNIYQYGETPLTTMETIARYFGIQQGEEVIELGCGRGRLALWLNLYWGCRVYGVEEIKTFVDKANRVIVLFGLQKELQIVHGDFLKIELPQTCQWVYLYGSSWDGELLCALAKKLAGHEVKVISVSFPLSDYDQEGHFKEIDCMQAHFPWGETTVYLSAPNPIKETT